VRTIAVSVVVLLSLPICSPRSFAAFVAHFLRSQEAVSMLHSGNIISVKVRVLYIISFFPNTLFGLVKNTCKDL